MTAENPIYDLLIDTLRTRKVSDFHIHADQPIHVRESGEITPLNFVATNEMMGDLMRRELGDEAFEAFDAGGDVDFAIQHEGQRFRANGYRMMHGYAMVLRVIVTDVPHIDALGLPPAVHQVLTKKSGLVLVTGQTGSGKSTSLAAMIDKINRERNENIITVEDPIEFVHQSKKSIITQREVGRDTRTFASALKGALRQDPDIILMGELRDYETVSTALTAARRATSLARFCRTARWKPSTGSSTFPGREQAQARSQLSQSLRLHDVAAAEAKGRRTRRRV